MRGHLSKRDLGRENLTDISSKIACARHKSAVESLEAGINVHRDTSVAEM